MAASIPRPRFEAGHNDAPDTLEGQVEHMRRWGYVRLRKFVATSTLTQLQLEFRKEQAAVLRGSPLGEGKMIDLPFGVGKVLEGPMAGPLLEVIESLAPLASRVVGEDVQIINIQPRTVASTQPALPGQAEPKGYTSWHRDEGNANGVFVHPLITTNVKLIVAVGDQSGGLEGSTVLPGTHRVHDGPASCVGQIESTHQRVFAGSAGDACLFDTKTWHTVQPNLSGAPRECENSHNAPMSHSII